MPGREPVWLAFGPNSLEVPDSHRMLNPKVGLRRAREAQAAICRTSEAGPEEQTAGIHRDLFSSSNSPDSQFRTRVPLYLEMYSGARQP